MSFLKSIFLGCEGSYTIWGIQVQFQDNPPIFFSPPTSLEGAGLISKLAYQCLNSHAFRWITQGYAHVFTHEMSHALACKLFTQQDSMVYVFKNLCVGRTLFPYDLIYTADWKKTIVNVAGSMGNMTFSSCKLVAATAMKKQLSLPIAFTLGSGAVIWMSGEFFYAYISASKGDDGDFGLIARRGNIHLALASAALISQCAVAIFTAVKLAA